MPNIGQKQFFWLFFQQILGFAGRNMENMFFCKGAPKYANFFATKIFPQIPMQLAVIVIVFKQTNELSMKNFKVEPALDIDGPESAR